MIQQPSALWLADLLDGDKPDHCHKAAAELRRLHEVNVQLMEALNEMCAEFRALDLPYGSKAYDKASTAIATAKGET